MMVVTGKFLYFFSCGFTISTADVNTYCKVYLTFPGIQARSVEYLGFSNCYGNSDKKDISWRSET